MHPGIRSRARVVVALVVAAGLSACGIVGGAGSARGSASAAPSPVVHAKAWHFISRPDLTPPLITSTTGANASTALPDAAGQDVFLGPKDTDTGVAMQGELIIDSTGAPVWVSNSGVGTFNFREQTYQGKPVLTYWAGNSTSYGHGDVVILDDTYTRIATVTTGGDLGPHEADMHESEITPQGTMLLTSYPEVRADLSGIGGPKDGWVLEGVAQEVDIATGKVRFEWRSLDHVPVTDTYQPLNSGDGTQAKPFDYFHINAVQIDGPGQVLISARHTHAIYQVARATGSISWQLGGKHSSFTFGKDAAFAWQHDARRQADGTITMFDNEAAPTSSRGLRLKLDMASMTASVAAQYLPPTSRQAATQGNVQVLPNGNVFVGWGQEPYYSEYTGGGKLLADESFSQGTSYRAFLAPWVGKPTAPPDAALTRSGSTATVYVSWNGATQVASWRVRTGTNAKDAASVTTVPRSGFETAIPLRHPGAYIQVQALDASGAVLGSVVVR
ncbi:MAG TPA: arylsulfotransferase family protein [Propionibacteriaceae bacterium]|nr:arylsulfotransferase family protein [Propionibacteriaceae bacterium]